MQRRSPRRSVYYVQPPQNGIASYACDSVNAYIHYVVASQSKCDTFSDNYCCLGYIVTGCGTCDTTCGILYHT